MRSWDEYKKTMKTEMTLWSAAKEDNLPALTRFIADGQPFDEKDSRGYSPLMLAVYSGSSRASQLLLSYGADPNSTDHAGNTVLMGAAFKGYPDLVLLLLKMGADINIRNAAGLTALDFANTFGRGDVAKVLRRFGGQAETSNRLVGLIKAMVGRMRARRESH